MPLDRCLKCDCEIEPDPEFKVRLCDWCRAENWGWRRPDGKGDPHPSQPEFVEMIWLVDARDEIDPMWREVPLETMIASAHMDFNDFEYLQRLAEGS